VTNQEKNQIPEEKELIIVRGAGDLATGVIQKFHRSGFRVLILETSAPTAIRRSVAFCEAVYDGVAIVEGITCRKISNIEEAKTCWDESTIPLLIDPDGDIISQINPAAVIDAIMAKRNLGTKKSMANITIALGPGFFAGEDVHVVIETLRGHDLGRMILKGNAKPDTGVPGEIAGESDRRVIHAPIAGVITHNKQIGDIVKQGEILFFITNREESASTEANKKTEVRAPISGLLRGLIREKTFVHKGMKVADIDSRIDVDWRTISDKARCIGGAALEAYLYLKEVGKYNDK